MLEEAFRSFLQSQGISAQEIDGQINFIQSLERHLKTLAPTLRLEDLNQASVQSLVDFLIDTGDNTYQNFLAMVRYAKVIQNDAMFVSVFQHLDGCEVMENLHKKIAEFAGEDLRDIIFDEMPLPPLGLSGREKTLYTYRILNRMDAIFEETTCREIIKDCLRDLPEALYQEDKKDYYEICHQDIDQFLGLKGKKFIDTLERFRRGGDLFFGQKITKDVIEFIKSNTEIGQGVRVGNIIYETKIPYNTKAYMEESDPVKKRYQYCHCPWARESILKSAFVVPAMFCQCSAGFHKKRYEVVLGQALRAEVLKSVLKGDLICRFAIHLPE